MGVLAVGTALTASGASAGTTAGGFTPGGPVHLVGAGSASAQARGAGIRHQAESTNWSGYAATTGTYTSISASWTQPAGTCSRGDQYAAFWVGLDGYSSSTVEQTGSEVDCSGRTPQYYAWYEMYPGPSEDYSYTVKAGDHFTATVTALGGDNFSLQIADSTQRWSQDTKATLDQTPALSSAEAIVEAPCCTYGGGALPLTDFGTANFSGATANGSAIGSASGLTEIAMVDNFGRDKDIVSALSGGENFSATWLRSS